MRRGHLIGLAVIVASGMLGAASAEAQPLTVGETVTKARAEDGSYISWREHIIDEPATAGFNLSGSDGLVMADLDDDGFEALVPGFADLSRRRNRRLKASQLDPEDEEEVALALELGEDESISWEEE